MYIIYAAMCRNNHKLGIHLSFTVCGVSDILTLDSIKEASESVTNSSPEIVGTAWYKVVKSMRTFIGSVFARRRAERQLKKPNLRTMWVSPGFVDTFAFSPGSLSMKHKIGSGSFGVVYLAEDKVSHSPLEIYFSIARSISSAQQSVSPFERFVIERYMRWCFHVVNLRIVALNSMAFLECCFVDIVELFVHVNGEIISGCLTMFGNREHVGSMRLNVSARKDRKRKAQFGRAAKRNFLCGVKLQAIRILSR